MKVRNTLGNLIEVLTQIKNSYGDGVQANINLLSDKQIAITGIYLDNAESLPQIFIEGDYEDRKECGENFVVYSSDGILETLIENKNTLFGDSFLYDYDKMYDLMTLPKDEFLNSYIYLSDMDYDVTLAQIKPTSEDVESNESQIRELAELMRQAENLYIEEMNGRATNWLVKGSQLKDAVNMFVKINLSIPQIVAFAEECEAMAV